ncbi:hypothetical protein [Nocardia asiatica]|uniref:hypothetical protein n=1 Tax=Nocardia asiatica TaxID=209252 RepID=UPI0024552C79|nr:hypothetical protein [Nocardia asiatica]
MVVSGTFHRSEGNSVDYTLYCVSDRGAVTDEGFLLPVLVVTAVHVAIVTAVVLLGGLWVRRSTLPPADPQTTAFEPLRPRIARAGPH